MTRTAGRRIPLQPPLSEQDTKDFCRFRCVRRVFISLLACVIASLTACSSPHYDQLVSENVIPELRALREAGDRMPQRHIMVPTQHDGEPVVDLAVTDAGAPDAERVLVMLHGILSDHSIWRFVRGDLGRDHRLIIFDLPGAGASDKPPPEALRQDGYTPRAVAERLLQALRLTFDATDWPAQITLVGHSFGGAVAIQMAGDAELRDEYRDIIDRLDRMVLFTPGDVEMVNPPEMLVEVAMTTDMAFLVAESTTILRERVAEGIGIMFCEPAPGLREEADTLVRMLEDPATRAAQQAILRQFIPLTEDRRLDWPRARAVTRAYRTIDVPTLIVWGEFDETLPVAMGYKLAAEIPGAQLLVIPSCMHSSPLERPRETAEIIREFSRKGDWSERRR